MMAIFEFSAKAEKVSTVKPATSTIEVTTSARPTVLKA